MLPEGKIGVALPQVADSVMSQILTLTWWMEDKLGATNWVNLDADIVGNNK